MEDDYTHFNSGIFYVPTNIPGSFSVDDSESEMILDSFNSQLTQHCKCKIKCNEECDCIIRSGGPNYKKSVFKPGFSEFFICSKVKTGNITIPIFECNDFCTCSTNCGNRIVQKGPTVGLIVRNCHENPKGLGLFAEKCIPKGTFICEYAGEIISKCEALKRHRVNELLNKMNYIMCLNECSNGQVTQTIVDPCKFGNIGRYINHSCEPNCEIIPVRFDSPVPHLAVFSKEDIAPNSEITFSYQSDQNKTETVCGISHKTKCLCGSQFCRKFLPFDSY